MLHSRSVAVGLYSNNKTNSHGNLEIENRYITGGKHLHDLSKCLLVHSSFSEIIYHSIHTSIQQKHAIYECAEVITALSPLQLTSALAIPIIDVAIPPGRKVVEPIAHQHRSVGRGERCRSRGMGFECCARGGRKRNGGCEGEEGEWKEGGQAHGWWWLIGWLVVWLVERGVVVRCVVVMDVCFRRVR